jgi:hypothetical protein
VAGTVRDGAALAGLSVSLPSVRYDPHRLRSLVVTLNAAAHALEEALAPFGVAGYDGAFVALQSEGGRPVSAWMDQLADSVAALGAAIIAAD